MIDILGYIAVGFGYQTTGIQAAPIVEAPTLAAFCLYLSITFNQ